MGIRRIRADLHNHLRTRSTWKEGDFNRAINITRKRLGQGGIFGLVNFSDNRYETFSELSGYDRAAVDEDRAIYVPGKDVIVVKGQEVPTQQGHLLVLGLQKGTHLADGRKLEDSLKEAKDLGGITLADHPFYKEGIGPYLKENPELINEIDAIETFNAEASLWIPFLTPARANRKAEKFFYAQTPRKGEPGQLASSDGHSFYELGSNFTYLWMNDDYAGFSSSQLKESIREPRAFPIAPAHMDLPVAFEKRSPQRIPALVHASALAWDHMIKPKLGLR